MPEEVIGSASVRLKVDDTPLRRGMDKARRSVRAFARDAKGRFISTKNVSRTSAEGVASAWRDASGRLRDARGRLLAMGRAAEQSGRRINLLSVALRKVTLAVAGFFAVQKIIGIIKAASRESLAFGDQLAFVATMLDERTMPAMNRFSRALLEFSSRFGEDTKTLSKGLFDVLSASIDARDAVDFLRVGVESARGGFTDTAITIDALTTLINAYGKSAGDVGKVSDILFATVKRGKTTFGELSQQIGQVAAIAASLKVPLEEVGAAIATMTRSGLSTADAVTSLRSILVQILRPTDEFLQESQRLGVQIDRTKLQTVGLTGVLRELAQAGPAAAGALFRRVEAIRGLAILLPQVAEFEKDVATIQQSQGARHEALNKALSTGAQKWRELGQKVKNFVRESRSLRAALDGIAEVLGDVVDALDDFRDRVGGTFEAAFASLGTLNPETLDRVGKGIAEIKRIGGPSISPLAALFPGTEQRQFAEQFASIAETLEAARERFARRQRERLERERRERAQLAIEQQQALNQLRKSEFETFSDIAGSTGRRLRSLEVQAQIQQALLAGNKQQADMLRAQSSAERQISDIEERRQEALQEIEKLRANLRLLSERDAREEALRLKDAEREINRRFDTERALVERLTQLKIAAIEKEARKRKQEEQKAKREAQRARIRTAASAAIQEIQGRVESAVRKLIESFRTELSLQNLAPEIVGTLRVSTGVVEVAPLSQNEILSETKRQVRLQRETRDKVQRIIDILQGGFVR